MPDGLLRDCDWRISVQKQSDSLRLSSSTKLYTTSVSLNRETRQEWKRAGGAWSLKNVGTVSRLNPPTRGKHVSVFPGVCALKLACPRALELGVFSIALHKFAREAFTLVSLKNVHAAASELVFKDMLGWCVHCTECNDYNSEAWKHTHMNTNKHVRISVHMCRESP